MPLPIQPWPEVIGELQAGGYTLLHLAAVLEMSPSTLSKLKASNGTADTSHAAGAKLLQLLEDLRAGKPLERAVAVFGGEPRASDQAPDDAPPPAPGTPRRRAEDAPAT